MGAERKADQEIIAELRRPFPPASLGFKMQTQPKEFQGRVSQAMVVGFINSRHVSGRLNTVVPGLWHDTYVSPPPPLTLGLVCRLTISGVTHEDIGFSAALTTDIGVKTLYSDAFKRAAVKWGIGEFLYALPRMYVKPDQLTQRGDKWFMPDQTVTALRGRYAAWLQSDEAKQFGAPLEYGDSADPVGDVEEDGDDRTPSAQDIAAVLPAADGPIDPIEFLHAAIGGLNARAISKAAWAKMQAKALQDEDAAKEVASELGKIYTDLGGNIDAARARLAELREQQSVAA